MIPPVQAAAAVGHPLARLTLTTCPLGQEPVLRSKRERQAVLTFERKKLNRASTAAQAPDARLDRLDLPARICQSKDIRIQCIALAQL